MLCKKRPLKATLNPNVMQKVQQTCQIDKVVVESASGAEVPADHDLLAWLVPYAASMHFRFAVGRDGKTAYERNVGRRAVPPLAQFGERVWWMPLKPSNRHLGPLDARFEQGRYLGPRDGSNTVLVGTASGVVKARTIKRLPPGERWTGNLQDESPGSELKNFRKIMAVESRTEHLCSNHTKQFLCLRWYTNFDRCDERHCTEPTSTSLATDNCPGCANGRAGRRRAVDHSEQCRSRMEAITGDEH